MTIPNRSKLWKTADAGQISWWEDAKAPILGGNVRFDLDSWIGAPMLRKSLAGGPALHTGNWDGNLIVRPERLLKHLVSTYGVKPVRYNHSHCGQTTILGSNDTMMSISIDNPEAPKAYIQVATVKDTSLHNLSKLARGILVPDDPRKGFVFALAAGLGGYQLSRIGAAGTALERGNYTEGLLRQYDHVVADLKAESPCGRLVVMAGVPGGGKCVAKGTRVMDASTGVLLPVEEIVKRRSKILTFSNEKGVIVTTPSAWLNTGVKECLRVTTKAGHTLEATPEHPLLTPDGYKRLDQILPDEYVAGAALVPFPEEKVRISEDHVVLLAALLAEGNYTHNCVQFTNNDELIVGAVRNALKCVDGELRQYPGMKPFEWRVISPKESNPGFTKIRLLLNKYGMGHKLAPEKTIPEVVFRLAGDQLALFLGMLWSCDGSIEKQRGGDITLGMSSKQLIDEVQHLLLRFGIKSRVRPKTCKRDGKQFYSWDLRVISTSREKFKTTIPFWGEKVDKLAAIKLGQNPNDDNIPLTEGVREAIRNASERHLTQGGSLAPIGDLLGWEGKISTARFVSNSGRETISRRVLEAFVSVTKAEELAWITRVRWEKVISVVPVGEREVYDFTIPETHNFLANDLVAHNTFIARALLADVPNAAFVVVPPHLVKDLGSPELIPALVQAKNHGFDGPVVLVLEDADKVLVQREAGDMAAISSLLNLGDGILGGVIDARILATTNASKLEMDAATRRPGRLCSYLDVGVLQAEHATAVLRRLTGKNVRANKPVTLAQIYFEARKFGWAPPPKTPERPRNHFRDDILPEDGPAPAVYSG